MDELEMYVRSLTVVFGLACVGTLLVSPFILWCMLRMSAMMGKGK